jgi:hypothetical protein
MSKGDSDQCNISEEYPPEEAHRRFETAVRAALNTPPKPRKKMTRKGVSAQSKKRRPSDAA